ncbi:uncharacterized protein SEPMUDRAFT_16224, partial [Sphaerulina musiva SO2202]
PAPTPSSYVPTVADVPKCAQGCVTDLGGCATGDVNCVCRNTPYLNRLAVCVPQYCNATEVAQVVAFANFVCRSVGVTSLPSPSYAST